MSTATVQLNLTSGSTQQRLRAMALDSANVKASWDGLPANLQRAHRELLNLGQQQQRLGYLRHEERQSFRLHAEYVRRHQDAVQAHMTRLKSTIDTSPHLARYESLRASGGLDAAVASDPHMEQLHRAHRQMDDMRRQSAVMGDSQQLFDRWGMHGDFRGGEAASYWGRRAAFGTRDGQTPRTAGQWGMDTAKGAYDKASSTVRQVAGIFGAFSIGSFLHSSIKEFDGRTQDVQRIGSKLGGAFDDVGKALDRLRKTTAYTRRDIMPAIEAIGRVTGAGTVGGKTLEERALSALQFGRATGMGAGAAAQFAQMAVYGGASPELAWGMMNGVKMQDRSDAFLGMMSAAQAAMGQGQVSVSDGEAAKWAGYAADIGGDAYKNDRGAALIQKIIAGSRAMPNAYVQAMKLSTLANTGVYDLGGGVKADTSTMWGLEMAADSGATSVWDREMRGVVDAYGGADSESARYAMRKHFPGMSRHEIELVLKGKKRGTRFRDPKKELEKAPSMPEASNNAITETDRINADMEATYEAAGKVFLPAVHDFKDALGKFGEVVAGTLDITKGLQAALAHLHDNPRSALTSPLATVLETSAADGVLAKAAIGAGAYAAGNAQYFDDFKKLIISKFLGVNP